MTQPRDREPAGHDNDNEERSVESYPVTGRLLMYLVMFYGGAILLGFILAWSPWD
jgi:hypothetical protein